ncbi:hypothetical protein BO70DRAFT_398009 [Aspergillus heteromorphus CBS 117.55]|uniref:Meiotic recombination protein DMC1 n=1 Tax=Aspergillus heteromorphus CBS 117.55 TaxID=1448321 RepID=A0A317VZ00_9EURO|nr:uncharacterized protein BO70DRAFT_398009 [Aspergillus heteromorphus CBS 117.55]PWY77120.1 hypothetical protein BO70DRAFT_398009 [Aspergillus heteromorphus CBS 117.55]
MPPTTATTSNLSVEMQEAGGFLPSPAPSPSTTITTTSLLPTPRSQPLRRGSKNENTVISYIDKSLLSITRRHAKKFSSAFDADGEAAGETGEEEEGRGYESFAEVARDMESVVDVLWVSGTPSLQIPHLISLAVQVNSYLPEYPFSAKATFRLLRKLDEVFAALLTGVDGEGKTVSGCEGSIGGVVSMTEKVRIKSIAEMGRVVVVDVREREREDGGEDEDDEDDDDDDEDFGDGLGTDEYPPPGKWEMETAKVYEKTIQLLGDDLAEAGEFCDTDMAAGEEELEDGMCEVEDLSEDEI